MTFKAPALARLCAVNAYMESTSLVGFTTGAVFRSVDRWGNVGDGALHVNNLMPLLRSLFAAARLCAMGDVQWMGSEDADGICRWKDVRSAMRYVKASDPFVNLRVQGPKSTPLPQ